ncbi:Sulphatase-modifying factor protein [[Leptolyngbya] sp. PCC 7376]|uniref:formylglycine-generating enzyme family protein n=1 Tax=[Leptolyngbya] sp. PCC 7376 TaxID=111781 RepID=UPI00029F22B6|nr:formylglycine-generating enzyme family protein [[Leptolyngbya] sp. PCC 7376]AFY39962.1 Sulphatase-modifying factor protein [[Leptolyngbya] sp. PCC 7376]
MAELELVRTKRKALYYKEILATEPSEIALEMTKIPAGGFWMGTPNEEIERICKEYSDEWYRNESPQHWVNIPKFFIGKYQVTQAQWRVVAGWEEVERSLKPEPLNWKGDDLPVERVSWLEAKEFCARLSRESRRNYRLPTEAEWEYACRAVWSEEFLTKQDQKQWNENHQQPFHFGETLSDEVANYAANNVYGRGTSGEYRKETTAVGSFPANNFGLYDMHGNVSEWCEDDFHESYENAPDDGSAWLKKDSNRKIRRGGDWYSHPWFCRSASRYHNSRDSRNGLIGFRVACSFPEIP